MGVNKGFEGQQEQNLDVSGQPKESNDFRGKEDDMNLETDPDGKVGPPRDTKGESFKGLD